MEVWVPFRSISLFNYSHTLRTLGRQFFFQSKWQKGTRCAHTEDVHSSVIMPGWFYQKTPLSRKALTHLGQSTALFLGRTAGKAPSVVQLTAVKMVDNTNQFNSNFRNRSDSTSCKASMSFFHQMCYFEMLFALKVLVLKKHFREIEVALKYHLLFQTGSLGHQNSENSYRTTSLATLQFWFIKCFRKFHSQAPIM